MEPEDYFPCSQVPATGSYPKSHDCSPHPSHFLKIYSNIIPNLLVGISSDRFLSGFQAKILRVFIMP
jgi:hypothetical protein